MKHDFVVKRTTTTPNEKEMETRENIQKNIDFLKLISKTIMASSNKEFIEAKKDIANLLFETSETLSTIFDAYLREYKTVELLQQEREELNEHLRQDGYIIT